MITRFAEYVAQELEAGRCEPTWDFFDAMWFQTPGRGSIKVGEEEAFAKTFQVMAWREWFRRRVCLNRGHERNLPITRADQLRLYDAVQVANARRKENARLAKEAKERERQRLTDWP